MHYVYFANEGCEYPLHMMVKGALCTNEVMIIFITTKSQGNKELVNMKYVILE